MKLCSICKKIKELIFFPKKGARCKSCMSIINKQYRDNSENKEKNVKYQKQYKIDNKKELIEYQKQYYKENIVEKLEYRIQYIEENKEEIYEKNKQYRKENKEGISFQKKQYYKENKEEISEKNKKYLQDHKEEIYIKRKSYRQKYKKIRNEKEKQKRKNNPTYKLRDNISKIINLMLKKQYSSKNGQSCLKYLPYTIPELKDHIQSLFEPWMSWNNHGKYNSNTWNDHNTLTWYWQIDHIIPQSDLPYTSMEDDNFKKCWALENLRPYSAKQNSIDGAKRIRHKK